MPRRSMRIETDRARAHLASVLDSLEYKWPEIESEVHYADPFGWSYAQFDEILTHLVRHRDQHVCASREEPLDTCEYALGAFGEVPR